MTRTERTYYVVVALWSVPGWFMHPVYPMFLLSRGLDLFEINLVLATFLLSTFVFEVPTGAVADLYGRKRSFLLSCVVRATAFVLYYFADGFWACVVAELVDAIGLTLATGALDAWAVDGIHEEGDRRPADRLFARAAMITRTTMIAGGLVCGLIADRFGLGVPWLVAAVMFGLAFVVGAIWMYDDRPHRARERAASRPTLAAVVGGGVSAVRRHPVMRAICLLTALAAFEAMPVAMMWPPRVAAIAGEGFWLLGWVWALLNLAAVLGAAAASSLGGRVRRDRLLAGLVLWRGVCLAGAAVATVFAPMLAWLLVYELALAGGEPVMNAWLNEHVGARLRATVLSVRGMAFTFGGAVGLVVLGLVARATSIATAWLLGAALLVTLTPGFLWLGRVAARDRALSDGA